MGTLVRMKTLTEPTSDWGDMVAFDRRVASAAGVLNAGYAAVVDIVVEALAEGRWEGGGIHTPAQWVAWQTGCDSRTARRIVALAKRSSELPTVMSTFRSGGLSLDQAATVARFTPPEYE